MKLLAALLCAHIASVAATRTAHAATTLTFDDLSPVSPDWVPIPSGYGGLQWNNFGALDGSALPVTSGYRIGTVSPRNVAFNLSGNPGSISSGTGFTLHSAYLTSAFDVRTAVIQMHVRVQGLVGTTVSYDNTFTVSNTAPAFISFNYVGVDRVIFVASPDSPFALDNLTVTVPPPEAACTFVISPHSRVHGFGSETGVVNLTTQTGCDWSVSNTNTWVTILSSLNNSGSGTVTYAVTADPTAAGRSGFINIAGQSFAVSQSEQPTPGVELLTFDDLLPLPTPIEQEYGGLHWNNFGVLDGSVLRVTSGYRIGIVSPDNVAFNRYGDPASIGSDFPFSLNSAYLTMALDQRAGIYTMRVQVQGSVGGVLTYDNTYTLSNTSPTLIHFNYVGVDQVLFVPSPSTIFAMDNLTVTVPVDSDGDGVFDPADQCPDTPPGVVVNEHGCSIDQLVPCAGPVTGGAWRNHGEYLRAVIATAEAFLEAGLITVDERDAAARAARRSDCGKR